MNFKLASITVFLSALIFCGCSQKYSKPELSFEDDTERDEYTIYSLSIEYVYMNNLLSHNKREVKSIVIISQTADLDKYWRDKLVGELDDKSVPEELIGAWNRENESATSLQMKFDFDLEYYLVTRDELDTYNSDSFFTEFYKRYPDSNGLISISRIGYDETRKTALIHVIHSYGTLGARYYFLVLKRGDAGWEIERRIATRPYKK